MVWKSGREVTFLLYVQSKVSVFSKILAWTGHGRSRKRLPEKLECFVIMGLLETVVYC